jgi:hypothetical protein
MGIPVAGQSGAPLASGTGEFGVWAGTSFANPTLIGTATNRRFVSVGLRYGFVFGVKRDLAFEYTLDLVPAAILIQPPGAQLIAETANPRYAGQGRSAVYGAGVSPVGFKCNFARRRKWQPFVLAAGGFVYSAQPIPIPVPHATQFNFTFDCGVGVQIFTAGRKALTVGYQLDHISNAFRTNVNPGVDMHMVYVGFSVFRRRLAGSSRLPDREAAGIPR